MRKLGGAVVAAAASMSFPAGATSIEAVGGRDPIACVQVKADSRTVCADVAAFDQTLVYNRFGSFNPFGMMFALKRDLSDASIPPTNIEADACATTIGTEQGEGSLRAGKVRLKDCKRARPIVLRANPGDILHLRLTNLLRPHSPGFSASFCKQKDAGSSRSWFFREIRKWVSEGSPSQVEHHEAACETGAGDSPHEAEHGDGEWPRTRDLNVAIQGLTALNKDGKPQGVEPACVGLGAIAPDASVDCYYRIDREGPYFLASTAAPSGGEGDGGSITHGLFGAVVVEQTNTRWFRSQVTRGAFDAVWEATAKAPHSRDGGQVDALGRYDAVWPKEKNAKDPTPILDMLAKRADQAFEIVHTDLNAVVHRAGDRNSDDPEKQPVAFREFSVFFHDELKSFATRNFDELNSYGQLAGVRDGFAINYGASGMGAALLANRKGIGPAANCKECLYEEFFLSSWANGDPALLEGFPDDPSNVHHSYLNDAAVFRNFHAGPKETHVFHLHAHQWLSGNDRGRGSYLDSQTVGPQQGFTYNIYDGGLNGKTAAAPSDGGWADSRGSGNRNRTLGDSIFHCHLYPHFAQGMWELWRVHDVLEDGSRVLPDGQLEPGLSLAEVNKATKLKKRPGSVDPHTGKRIMHKLDVGAAPGAPRNDRFIGTPIPALVPIPGQAWPLLPTYPAETVALDPSSPPAPQPEPQPDAHVTTMPGYPFYVAGRPGHRPPQAPMDIARATRDEGTIKAGEPLDAGLPRHVIKDGAVHELAVALPQKLKELPASIVKQADGLSDPDVRIRERQQAQLVAKILAMGDMTGHLISAPMEFMPYDGTKLERAAMAFHGTGSVAPGVELDLKKPDGSKSNGAGGGGYETLGGGAAAFHVNGSPPKPGAPFADPCGVAKTPTSALVDDPFVKVGAILPKFVKDPGLKGFRRYEGSAVQLNLVTNRAGWHDPQARINVLTAVSDRYKDGGPDDPDRPRGVISPRISASEQPFFFRALSGECIEFRHTNELPKDLELDDFQVKTPTDTIGQHIHLVKFDVTSSDGSGNGFNYEDGTFAPDEIAMRICAGKTAGVAAKAVRGLDELALREDGLCEETSHDDKAVHEVKADFKNIWRRRRSDAPHLFQTTTQRWFADPVLSQTRAKGDGTGKPYDRTMRTVFTHDHFGPSSIQQHGFYSALIIEPLRAKVCEPERSLCTDQKPDDGFDNTLKLAKAGQSHDDWVSEQLAWVGSRKVVQDPESLDPDSPNFREFALAIADFATLYDPRDRESASELLAKLDGRKGAGAIDEASTPKGLAALYCEAKHAVDAAASKDPAALKARCGSALKRDNIGWFAEAENAPPAWIAAKRPGDAAEHSEGMLDKAITSGDVKLLREHLVEYRRKAAGYASANDAQARLAKPVNPPQRPESISVDHHDPYLVNYFGEPLPLRIGQGSGGDCKLKGLTHWVAALANGVTEKCSVTDQKSFPDGDMAHVFMSSLHGDPATPVMESYSSERVMFRLIQGAQEVQHTFTLEGYNWPRNLDQRFPGAPYRPSDATPGPLTHNRACERRALKRAGSPDLTLSSAGRPDQYSNWLKRGSAAYVGDDKAYWQGYEAYQAECPNIEGRVAAEEIGISEHFEFAGAYRQDFSGAEAAKIRPAGSPEFEKLRKDLTPSDTLQHFGSVDSLWNGAWSLLRVYKDRHAVDGEKIGQCVSLDGEAGETSKSWACLKSLAEKKNAKGRPIDTIGARLPPLPKGAMEGVAGAPATPVVAECRAGAPVVYAAAVAIESERVFGKTLAGLSDVGTPYGDRLYDRNGLFLALVDPAAIARGAEDGATLAKWLGQRKAWLNIDAEKVVDAVKSAYARPEPFTLHVRAGDCVKLTVINALREHGAGSLAHKKRPGLKDDLGDAPMPKITPLNVEPDWSPGEPIASTTDENTPEKYEQENRSNVRPSARLALGLPLPVLNHQQDISRPFGWNRKGALAPSRTSKLTIEDNETWGLRTANIEQLTFYAGRTGVPAEFDTVEELLTTNSTDLNTMLAAPAGAPPPGPINLAKKALLDELRSVLGLSASDFLEIAPTKLPPPGGDKSLVAKASAEAAFKADSTLFTISVLGGSVGKRLSDDKALKGDVEAIAAKHLAIMQDMAINWIPYAFGALPLKSYGDVTGHAVHGLFGAVVVHPRDAEFEPGSNGQLLEIVNACAAAPSRENCVFKATPSKPDKSFLPWAMGYTVKDNPDYQPAGDAAQDHRVRSFTLFWQDGLNLRDRDTRNAWRGRDTVSGEALAPKLVEDCAICDDSYDWGEAGVNYRSAPFHIRLRGEPDGGGGSSAERHYNLNAYTFPKDFFRLRPNEAGTGDLPQMPVLRAEEGDEVVVDAVHPGGRARQRSLVFIGHDYDDLFPGFGFPHAALLAPGKSVTAALRRPVTKGCSLWFDGPTQLRAAGAWGLLDVVAKGNVDGPSESQCRR